MIATAPCSVHEDKMTARLAQQAVGRWGTGMGTWIKYQHRCREYQTHHSAPCMLACTRPQLRDDQHREVALQ